MVEVRRKIKDNIPPPPSEYEDKPIVARLLVGDEDIEHLTVTYITLSLKKDFFNEYVKGAYVDLMFIGEQNASDKVYRYKMISELEDRINMRLECEVC